MTHFQLVLRAPGSELREYHYSSRGEPEISGRPILAGETYTIRGAEWRVEETALVDNALRVICTRIALTSD